MSNQIRLQARCVRSAKYNPRQLHFFEVDIDARRPVDLTAPPVPVDSDEDPVFEIGIEKSERPAPRQPRVRIFNIRPDRKGHYLSQSFAFTA